jgi:hypothetical protein
MNPPVVKNQLRAATVALSFLAISDSRVLRLFVVIACAVLAAYWLVVKSEYAYRTRDYERTKDRFTGDRVIAVAALLEVAVPALLVWLGGQYEGLRLLALGDWGVPNEVAIAAAILLANLHVSSLIDWYWIRPRRDGIVGDPVCRDGSIRRLKLMTRVLLWHRALTTLIFGLCASLIVYFVLDVVFKKIPDDSIWAGYTDAINTPIGLAVFALIGYKGGLIDASKLLGASTQAKFGDTVSVDLGHQLFRGKVFEVSLEGLTVVATNGDRHLAPLIDPRRIIHQNAPEDTFCPRTTTAGKPACGALDEDAKCQYGEFRLFRDAVTGDHFVPTPHNYGPVSPWLPW